VLDVSSIEPGWNRLLQPVAVAARTLRFFFYYYDGGWAGGGGMPPTLAVDAVIRAHEHRRRHCDVTH